METFQGSKDVNPGSKIIPGWLPDKSGIFKTMTCPKCKQSLATKTDTVKCKHCNRVYDLHEGNREKVVM